MFRPLSVILCLLLCFWSGSAKAQDSGTWTNGVNGDWSNAANWLDSGDPGVSGGSLTAIVFSNATATTLINMDKTAPFVLNKLTFTNSGALARRRRRGVEIDAGCGQLAAIRGRSFSREQGGHLYQRRRQF